MLARSREGNLKLENNGETAPVNVSDQVLEEQSQETTTSEDTESDYMDAENEVRVNENLETIETSMRAPSTLSFEGNLKENWQKWKRKFEYYLKATDLESKSEERKTAVLLHVADKKAMDKFETFGLSKAEKS